MFLNVAEARLEYSTSLPEPQTPIGQLVGFLFLRTLCSLAGHLFVVFLFLFHLPAPTKSRKLAFHFPQEGLLLRRRKK